MYYTYFGSLASLPGDGKRTVLVPVTASALLTAHIPVGRRSPSVLLIAAWCLIRYHHSQPVVIVRTTPLSGVVTFLIFPQSKQWSYKADSPRKAEGIAGLICATESS